MLIPYLPDVVVGPTPHMELAIRAASVLLEPVLEPMILGDPTVRQPAQIRNSRVPYRDW